MTFKVQFRKLAAKQECNCDVRSPNSEPDPKCTSSMLSKQRPQILLHRSITKLKFHIRFISTVPQMKSELLDKKIEVDSEFSKPLACRE